MVSTINPQLISSPLRQHLPKPVKKFLRKIEETVLQTTILLFPQVRTSRHSTQQRTFKAAKTETIKPPVEVPPSVIEISAISTGTKPRLIVMELTGSPLKTAEKTTAAWAKIAAEKAKKEPNLFLSSEQITQAIASNLQRSLSSNNRVFACFDSLKNEQQAIAIVSNKTHYSTQKPYLYVNLLATNPNNIRSPINKKETQVAGAGTALISYLTKVCKNENKEELHLTSLHTAVPFYKKIGFQEESPGSFYNLLLKVT